MDRAVPTVYTTYRTRPGEMTRVQYKDVRSAWEPLHGKLPGQKPRRRFAEDMVILLLAKKKMYGEKMVVD
jgi:hypothetical protein